MLEWYPIAQIVNSFATSASWIPFGEVLNIHCLFK